MTTDPATNETDLRSARRDACLAGWRCAPRRATQLGCLPRHRLYVVTLSLLAFGGTAQAADNPIAQINRLVDSGKLDDAAKFAREMDDANGDNVEPTLALARVARAFHRAGDLQAAAEFYSRSVSASTRPAAKGLPPNTVILVRLAAASVLIQANQLADALETVSRVLAEDAGAGDSQVHLAVKLCLRIGSSAFAIPDHAIAYRAYSLASQRAGADEKPTAMLGAAWALALGGGQPVLAAQQLAAFIDVHPDHPDASRAARACAACMKQAGRDEDANAMLADLLRRWPKSDAATQVVANQPDTETDLAGVASAVRQWLLTPAALDRLEQLDGKTIRLGLFVSAAEDDSNAWAAYSQRLAEIDSSGKMTAGLLQLFSASKQDGDAESLAAMFLAPTAEWTIAPAARESACRWAGRQQRWTMLALASESESPDQDVPSRTVVVERLFAEALMQTGRHADSHRWWTHLVDERGTDDFATLLRCAETETSIGSDVAVAADRIGAARSAAQSDPFHLILVSLLEAELGIRQMQFDLARSRLNHVVASDQTDRGLRGRAQWLIGETHFLQQDFVKSIEAYRRVETIDSNGMWVEPSLIQAAKSFEQLGRTRDAAVCYWALVKRFPESPYRGTAMRRLAVISPEQNELNHSSDQTHSSDQILRR